MVRAPTELASRVWITGVTLPHVTHTARTDVDAGATLARPAADHGRPGEGVIEDSQLNLGSDPVGISPFTAGQFVEEALGAIGLVITTNFVELLTTVADELACFADVI